jgi:hypothetical protein
MTGGRGWRGQVPNEEVPYHERSIQDMIKDLQKQAAELTHRLVAQNMDAKCDINGCNSESNFENSCHNLVPVREHRGRDEEFVDEEFQEDEFVDEEFKHRDVHDDVEHEDVKEWIEIFHQLMISISIMKILWEILCHMIKRTNL